MSAVAQGFDSFWILFIIVAYIFSDIRSDRLVD